MSTQTTLTIQRVNSLLCTNNNALPPPITHTPLLPTPPPCTHSGQRATVCRCVTSSLSLSLSCFSYLFLSLPPCEASGSVPPVGLSKQFGDGEQVGFFYLHTCIYVYLCAVCASIHISHVETLSPLSYLPVCAVLSCLCV